MKNFLSMMILVAALIVGGCTSESFSTSNVDGDIHVTGKNCTDSHGSIKLDGDGNALVGESKIESGRVEMQVGEKNYRFDKSGDISVDVPAGVEEIFFSGFDNFTGELKLKAVPKI